MVDYDMNKGYNSSEIHLGRSKYIINLLEILEIYEGLNILGIFSILLLI